MKIKLERRSSEPKIPDERGKEIIKSVLAAIVFVTPLIFFAYAYDSYTLPKAIFLQLACSVLLAVWLISSIVKGEFSLKKSPLNLPVFLFFVAGVIATIFSIDKTLSFWGAYKRHEGLVTLVFYTLLFFASANFLNKKEGRFITNVFLTVASITSLYGILQYFGIDFVQIELGTGADITRSFATFGNPVFLAAFLVMAFPISCAFFAEARAKEDKCLYGMSTVLITFGLLFTASRGGWIGGFVGFVFLLIFSLKHMPVENKRLILIFVSFFIFILLITLTIKLPSKTEPLFSRVLSILEAGRGTAGTRLLMWKGSLKMIAARPIVGYGPDTLKLVMPKYVSTKFYL
ncbi:MAG: O-antigen ligase family protein, partial [Candidatus Subteraquimicrobiales bacterium]|nr:O-antigen ligase family protein [Candidatus Subteraquimicrobiales bacterium]